MALHFEICLIQHLCIPESLSSLVDDDYSSELIPTAELRPVYDFAIRYWHQESSRDTAPPPEVLRLHYGNILAEHEINLDIEPEGTLTWAIEALRSSYLDRQWQEWVKVFATNIAEAPLIIKEEMFSSAIDELMQVQSGLVRKTEQVDLRHAMERQMDLYIDRQRRRHDHTTLGARLGMELVDNHTGLILPGELCMLAAGPKTGKAQPLTAPVLTPTGWVKMGDLRVGEFVIGQNGRPTKIVAVHPQGVVDIFLVTTNDGAQVEVTGGHLWQTWAHVGGGGRDRPRLMTTEEVGEVIRSGRLRSTYIPVVDPVHFGPERELPIDPYVMGLLLGDGGMTTNSISFTTADDELIQRIQLAGVEVSKRLSRYSWGVKGIVPSLRGLGLVGLGSWEKHIPEAYLWASPESRLAMIQGLLDTDGGAEKASVRFCTSSLHLKDGMVHLVESLGGITFVRRKENAHRGAWIISIKLPEGMEPFRLSRKLEQWQNAADRSVRKNLTRRIVSVEHLRQDDAQCISVASPDGLYVADRFVVTHNSFALLWGAFQTWLAGGSPVLITLENSVDMTLNRIACMCTGINSRNWQRGECTPDEITRVLAFAEQLKNSPRPFHIIQPEPGKRTIEQMVRRARILGDSLYLDQTSFIEVDEKMSRRSKTEQIGGMLHELKSLINSSNKRIPCILAHQISREGIKLAEKIGHLEMYHMADSAEVERTADWVFGLWQSRGDRDMDRALLQSLASRREDLVHWSLNWRPYLGTIVAERAVPLPESS